MMPGKKAKSYDSERQMRWAHTPSGKAALGEADVERKDKASRGKFGKKKKAR